MKTKNINKTIIIANYFLQLSKNSEKICQIDLIKLHALLYLCNCYYTNLYKKVLITQPFILTLHGYQLNCINKKYSNYKNEIITKIEKNSNTLNNNLSKYEKEMITIIFKKFSKYKNFQLQTLIYETPKEFYEIENQNYININGLKTKPITLFEGLLRGYELLFKSMLKILTLDFSKKNKPKWWNW